MDGNIIFNKGDIVLKETLEQIKQNFTTQKPSQSTVEKPQEEIKTEETKPAETKPEETKPSEPTPDETIPEEKPSKVEEGKTNPNGTYTIYGVTYKSKADYEQFLLHPEQYGFYNGMVLSLEDIEELFNQKTK